jgi:hypothetical protein
MTKKINISFFIIVLFFALVFLPSRLPAVLKMPTIIGVGGLCILLEIISLIKNKSDKKILNQTIVLILITVLLFVINLFI